MTIDTLWYTRCPAPTAASIAIRLGWLADAFAPDGVAVRSLAASTDRDVHLSHYRQTQPNAFRFGGWVPPLIARAQGADVRVVGLSWHDRVSGVFALPDSGIRSPQDLKGRRFCLPRRVNDDIDWWRATVLGGYEHLLATTGLAPAEVPLVEVPITRQYVEDATVGAAAGQSLWGAQSQFAVQREEVAALLRGDVDLVYSDAALGAILRAVTGARLVVPFRGLEDDSEAGFGHPIVLTTSASLIEKRPDLVRRWIGRLLDASSWADAHPDEARRIFAQDTGLPEDFVSLAYSDRLGRQADVSLAPDRVSLLRRKKDLLRRHGFLAQDYDFDALIHPAPLADAIAARARRYDK
jgi:ABC-type nitrate/sulfonate/bicarbonate transport system substrate-binding protein